MHDEQRLALGSGGIAFGNVLLATGSWLRGEPLILVGGQLVMALGMVALAAGFLSDSSQYEPPSESRMWQWLPTIVVFLGLVMLAVGGISVAVAILG